MGPPNAHPDAVRVIRNLRNDGTYPGLATGTLLIRRGATGFVRDVGIAGRGVDLIRSLAACCQRG